MHIGPVHCAQLLTRVHAELRALEKLEGHDASKFKTEREFTALLPAMIEHSEVVQGPVIGCMTLHQELASSSDKNGQVDHESLRKKFKEARMQAGITKQPNWGGLMAGGMQPMSLAPAFHAGAPAFPSVQQQYSAQGMPGGFGSAGHYGPSLSRGGGRGFGGVRRGGRGGRGARKGHGKSYLL